MREINYSRKHWKTLETLRNRAIKLLNPITENHIQGYVYGSISRGDTHQGSDIDIFIPSPPASSILETLIENAGFPIQNKVIIQATPTYTAKGYIYVDEKESYSFPLTNMKTVEHEFYSFAGKTTKEELEKNFRVPGVDKKLMLIEPTDMGHVETSIIGREGKVAKILRIKVRTVQDRVKTLERREKIGRTGVYIKTRLNIDESFGEKFHELSISRPALRRRQRRK